MDSFANIINLWGSAAELARDLGLKEVTVRAWRNRDGIPSEYWKDLEAAALKRGIATVTIERLATIAANQRITATDTPDPTSKLTERAAP